MSLLFKLRSWTFLWNMNSTYRCSLPVLPCCEAPCLSVCWSACMVIPIKSYNSNAQHSIFTIARNTTVQSNCIAYNSVCRSACKVIPLKNSNNDLNPAAPHRWPQIHQQQQWQAYILWSRQVSTHCNNRHKKCWQFWIEIWPFASSHVSVHETHLHSPKGLNWMTI